MALLIFDRGFMIDMEPRFKRSSAGDSKLHIEKQTSSDPKGRTMSETH